MSDTADQTASSIQYCDELRESLPDEVGEHLDRMLNDRLADGDVEVLYRLLPADLRGPLLLCLHHWNAAPEVLRECIRHFWKVDSGAILKPHGFSLECAREMFRQAQFPLPHDIPQIVRVWRGTAGRTLEQACEGLCWTLDRDAACWFATVYEDQTPGDPIVVTASIQADQILFFDQNDGLHEREVVLDRIAGGDIDPGAEAEWLERARQYIKKRKEAGW